MVATAPTRNGTRSRSAPPAHAAITCPAGEGIEETIKGPACRCHIVHETITADDNGGSLKAFCAGDFRACPIWQRQQKAEAEGRARKLEREIAASDQDPARPV